MYICSHIKVFKAFFYLKHECIIYYLIIKELDSSIHYHQLNEIQNFVNNVKENNTNSNQEHVLFDVICGDFNIDNISPGFFNLN